MKCIDCKYWKYYPKEDDLSDVTPGEHAEFYCSQNHFYHLGYSITTDVLRTLLNEERECESYEKWSAK